jgi:hypothetical protein
MSHTHKKEPQGSFFVGITLPDFEAALVVMPE